MSWNAAVLEGKNSVHRASPPDYKYSLCLVKTKETDFVQAAQLQGQFKINQLRIPLAVAEALCQLELMNACVIPWWLLLHFKEMRPLTQQPPRNY